MLCCRLRPPYTDEVVVGRESPERNVSAAYCVVCSCASGTCARYYFGTRALSYPLVRSLTLWRALPNCSCCCSLSEQLFWAVIVIAFWAVYVCVCVCVLFVSFAYKFTPFTASFFFTQLCDLFPNLRKAVQSPNCCIADVSKLLVTLKSHLVIEGFQLQLGPRCQSQRTYVNAHFLYHSLLYWYRCVPSTYVCLPLFDCLCCKCFIFYRLPIVFG